MDYELLKKAVDRIKMPEDMKTRIITEVRNSCVRSEEQEQRGKVPKNEKI